MKSLLKGFFILSAMLCFASCADNADALDPIDPVVNEIANLKTEVYVNGSNVESGQNGMRITRASVNIKEELGYSIPEDGKYRVFYYIRIDGNIPGEDACNFPANDYFPRSKTGKTIIDTENMGYVIADADWKSNSKFSKYVYASDGVAVRNVIVTEPSIEQLLGVNQGVGDDFSGFIENADKLHFLWYICKKQDGDHCWHIDGILTSKDRNDISETIYGDEIVEKYPEDKFDNDKGVEYIEHKDVEVDIHQQEHKDWCEIKTSVHISSVTDVEIEMPIELDYICEVDDFAVRAFEYQDIVVDGTDMKWNGTVSVIVEHQADKTVLKISGITKEILDNHNGLVTIEVHSYYKSLADEELWNRLKNSSVELSNKRDSLKGQIHYKDDEQDKWIIFE